MLTLLLLALQVDRWGDPLPAGAVARIGTERMRHDHGSVMALAFRPDGKHLVSVGTDGTIREWEVATGKGRVTERMTDTIVASAFSRDASRIAVGTKEGHIKVFPGESRLKQRPELTALEFTADATGLAIGEDKGRLTLCDITSGAERWSTKHEGSDSKYTDLEFSPDGRWLTTASGIGHIRLFDAATGRFVDSQLDSPAHLVAWAPDSKTFVTNGNGAGFWLLGPLRRGKVLNPNVGVPAFSPDGSMVAAFEEHSRIVLRPVAYIEKDVTIKRSNDWFGWETLAFSPDGKLIAASTRRTIEVYDIATKKALHDTSGFDFEVETLAFVDGGKKLLTLSQEDSAGSVLRVWDAATGDLLKRANYLGNFAGLTADGRRLFTHASPLEAEADELTEWDAATLERGREIPLAPRTNGQDAVVISPDGSLVALAERGGKGVRIHAIPDGRLIVSVAKEEAVFRCLSFMADGRTLLAGSFTLALGGPTGTLWDIASGKQIFTFLEGTVANLVAVPSSDGRLLALKHEQDAIEVWDLAGRCRLHYLGSVDPIDHPIAFTPDGRRLVAEVGKKELRVWELFDGKECIELRRPGSGAIAVAPDGRVAAVLGSTVVVWKLPDPAPFPRVEPAQIQALWAEVCGDDAAKSFRAGWLLTGGGDAAVDFLARTLAPPEEDVADLMRRLDSDDSGVRDEATAALAAKEWGAERALRRALAAPPSVEAKLRIELLLAGLQKPAVGLSGYALRRARGVAILGRIGTPKAREALKGLGGSSK